MTHVTLQKKKVAAHVDRINNFWQWLVTIFSKAVTNWWLRKSWAQEFKELKRGQQIFTAINNILCEGHLETLYRHSKLFNKSISGHYGRSSTPW